MALHMCQMASQDGIEHMVATPHANGEFSYDRNWLRSVLEELQKRNGGKPKLSLGCDFHFSYDNIQAVIAEPDNFVIAGGDYLLVELSDFAMSPAIFTALEKLVAMGIRPIITHPERNMMLQRHAEDVLRFAQKGCAIQITASHNPAPWNGLKLFGADGAVLSAREGQILQGLFAAGRFRRVPFTDLRVCVERRDAEDWHRDRVLELREGRLHERPAPLAGRGA